MTLRINSRSINKGSEITEMNLMSKMGGLTLPDSEMCSGSPSVQMVSCKAKRKTEPGAEHPDPESDHTETEFPKICSRAFTN